MAVKTKICSSSSCQKRKNIRCFSKNKSLKDGYSNFCKTCASKAHKKWSIQYPDRWKLAVWKSYIKRKHRVTFDQYTEMLKKQSGTCAICKQYDTDRKLAVDHCHETGQIRGLLCNNCNNGLGRFQDDIIRLQQAIKYLRR